MFCKKSTSVKAKKSSLFSPLLASLLIANASAFAIDIDPTGFVSYDPLQDLSGTATVVDNSLIMSGNNWKSVEVNYNITENTVLEFDFSSDSEGEVHGIGFDTNLDSSDNEQSQLFQIFGSQNAGVTTYSNYQNITRTANYKIPVGLFYQGAFANLFFANDDDASAASQSTFSNIKIYEGNVKPNQGTDIIDLSNIRPYGRTTSQIVQDQIGKVNTKPSSAMSIELNGNRWRTVKFPTSYNISAGTTFNFEFQSAVEGEIHGIFVGNQIFQLHGTQTFGNQDYSNYEGDNVLQEFSIPVGQYFQGNINGIILISDDDLNADSNSVFQNMSFNTEVDAAYQPLPKMVDLSQNIAFSSQDGEGDVTTIAPGAKSILLAGNKWVYTPITQTQIKPDSVLEFDFSSEAEGEIHGIIINNRLFKVFGSQSIGIMTYDDYSTADNTKRYTIPLGQFTTGTVNGLFLLSDDDANEASHSIFSNIKIYQPEQINAAGLYPYLDLSDSQAYLAQNGSGDIISQQAKEGTVELLGNRWQKVSYSYEVKPTTILEFEFKSTAKGEKMGMVIDS